MTIDQLQQENQILMDDCAQLLAQIDNKKQTKIDQEDNYKLKIVEL